MLFSSIVFIYFFLPMVILLYFLLPFKYKNVLLLISSLCFYAWGEPKYSILMVFSIIEGFTLGRFIEKERSTKRGRILVMLSIVMNLSLLGYFKYFNFFLSNINGLFGCDFPLLSIALPMGISFYIFSIISYTIDIYRERFQAEKNIVDFATYISLFPQLVAGPIIRYSDIYIQLHERSHSFEACYYGGRRFIIGLAKKVLLANSFGLLVTNYQEASEQSVLLYWIYAVAFTLQIYYDFSGYSDMAIGLGRIFGFRFLENFNYPYISQSISDFWRRWHISLGAWFKDYVYIPLGGNRVLVSKQILNLLTVWMLTGFWHGASWNFVIWGLYYAVILIFEKFFLKKIKPTGFMKCLTHIYVMVVVIVGFVLFNADTLKTSLVEISGMFGLSSIPLLGTESLYFLRSYAVVFLLGIIGATPILKTFYQKLSNKKMVENLTLVLEPVFLTILMLIITGYLVDGSYNPFLYFRF